MPILPEIMSWDGWIGVGGLPWVLLTLGMPWWGIYLALHLDLFRGDKCLLRAYLNAYGLDQHIHQILPTKAINMTLLHRFNTLAQVFRCQYLQVSEIATLNRLATLLWDVNVPGLVNLC